ncbi:MAG: Coenzyme F420 hydrogenase/dehydrogenase, beta subunit C-terminal domain [Planctomycetota bacterium]
MSNITGYKNVCTEVVGKNLCIGCGLCAGVCPRENLKIYFNRFGEYNALEIGNGCGGKCNLCLKVCPFYNNKDNEDTLAKTLFGKTPGIRHTPECGYYLDAFLGYSSVRSHRENGASGGLATWTLESAINSKLVDHVVCVSSNNDPEKLYKFAICSNPAAVRASSKSCYYPVEASQVTRHILEVEGSYAIIGLPCVCKAIRLAMRINPKLQRRIRFVLGLVCGQTKSKFFAEYICALGGGDPRHLKDVTFRIKDPDRPASDYGMRFVCDNGQDSCQEGVIYWTDGMDKIWCNRYFTPNACNFCDDAFAECADAVFMDAWTEPFKKDYRGHSIVLVRNSTISDLIEAGQSEGEVAVKNFAIDEVIQSQLALIHEKRAAVRWRLAAAKKNRTSTRSVRTHLMQPGRLNRHLETRIMWRLSRESGKKWKDCGGDIDIFQRAFLVHTYKLSIIGWARRLIKVILNK